LGKAEPRPSRERLASPWLGKVESCYGSVSLRADDAPARSLTKRKKKKGEEKKRKEKKKN